MTTNPQPTDGLDLSAGAELKTLLATVPVVSDVTELALPGVFEDDEEVEEFLDWYRAERRAQLA